MAGLGIEAGWGIEAGFSITCGATLIAAYRIFAGIASWKKTVTDAERTVTCQRLGGGEVAYGVLVETSPMETKA
jgi:hypothetical protein